ncbi:MAG: hypothetical protein JST68_15280 [Bacteroidetes bacterium]|nr:hypothetical protein [Bacteroidota bacterium]
MLLLLVNLYEFGQFLRILLWISVPILVLAMLITTWLHYRNKRKEQDVLALSMEGLDPSAPSEVLIAAMNGRPVMAEGEASPAPASQAPNEEAPADTGPMPEPEEKDHLYQGILWMKEKYEQYRDLADAKIFELKDQLRKAEQKYQDLLVLPQPAALSPHPDPSAPILLDQRVEELHKKLEEKDRMIGELQDQLQAQNQKTEELVAKLQNSSQLLLNISQELDRSFPVAEPRPASAAE